MTEKHTIHQSLNRPQQLFGGDRELVVSALFCCVVLAISVASVYAVAIAIVLWLIALYFLRIMGKADPMMRQVYLRHRKYAGWYPAKAGLYSKPVDLPVNFKEFAMRHLWVVVLLALLISARIAWLYIGE